MELANLTIGLPNAVRLPHIIPSRVKKKPTTEKSTSRTHTHGAHTGRGGSRRSTYGRVTRRVSVATHERRRAPIRVESDMTCNFIKRTCCTLMRVQRGRTCMRAHTHQGCPQLLMRSQRGLLLSSQLSCPFGGIVSVCVGVCVSVCVHI